MLRSNAHLAGSRVGTKTGMDQLAMPLESRHHRRESAHGDAETEKSSGAVCFATCWITTTWIMVRMIQAPATPMVILVKVSPAREPNALDPPTPPNAPASPPPLPR